MTAEERGPAWKDHDPESRPGEQWLPVDGFEGLYEVSDHGRVRSLDRVVTNSLGVSYQVIGRILKQRLNPRSGYLQTSLWRGNKGHTRRVHSLILESFVGPRPEGHECRHLNGKPDDNRLVNLAWGTPTENYSDQLKHGTYRNPTAERFRARTHCDRGHALQAPNLCSTPRWQGSRICLACDRVRHRIKGRVAKGLGPGLFTPDEEANIEHALILAGDPEVRPQATVCSRGHAVSGPNLNPRKLRAGQRHCLVCRRTHDLLGARKHRNPDYKVAPGQFEELADTRYAKILGEAGLTHDQLTAQAVQERRDEFQSELDALGVDFNIPPLAELVLEYPEQATGSAEGHGGGETPTDRCKDAGDAPGLLGDTINRKEAA